MQGVRLDVRLERPQVLEAVIPVLRDAVHQNRAVHQSRDEVRLVHRSRGVLPDHPVRLVHRGRCGSDAWDAVLPEEASDVRPGLRPGVADAQRSGGSEAELLELVSEPCRWGVDPSAA